MTQLYLRLRKKEVKSYGWNFFTDLERDIIVCAPLPTEGYRSRAAMIRTHGIALHGTAWSCVSGTTAVSY
jgi:hypothetical protein